MFLPDIREEEFALQFTSESKNILKYQYNEFQWNFYAHILRKVISDGHIQKIYQYGNYANIRR